MAGHRDYGGELAHSRTGKRLFISLRGVFNVKTAAGELVPISSARGAALLIFLSLADGCQVLRKELARHLWKEDRGKGDRRANLRQELSVLRALIDPVAPNALLSSNEAIWLDPALVWIDVKAEAAILADPSQTLPGWIIEKRELLSRGVELGTDFDDWLEDRRSEYRQLRSAAHDRRVSALAKADLGLDHKIAEFRALTDCDPSDQSSCQNLMGLLAFAGTATEVNRIYKRCADACAGADLPIDPETTEVRDETVARCRSRSGGGGAEGRLLVPAVASSTPATRPMFGSTELNVGVRRMINRSGDIALDGLTDLLHSHLMIDLAMTARPFQFYELASDQSPESAKAKNCGCIVTLGLELLRREHRPSVGINIELSCTVSGKLERSDRATQRLPVVREDPRLFSSVIASKLHFDLVFNLHSRNDGALEQDLSSNQLVVRGQMLMRRRNSIENLLLAREAFGAALRKDGNNLEAIVGLTHVLHRLASQPGYCEKPTEALLQGQRLIETVLEREPDHIQASYISAMISSSQGRPEHTQLVFDRMLSLTSHARAMTYRGYNAIFLDKPLSGLDDFDHALAALKDDASMPIWHFFKAVAHFHCGDLQNARISLQNSLQLDPGYSSAKLWLAGCELIADEDRDALTHMEQFRSAFPAYTLADFNVNWGGTRTRNHAYLSRTQRMADALQVLQLPQAR